jgi:hypothetical protein
MQGCPQVSALSFVRLSRRFRRLGDTPPLHLGPLWMRPDRGMSNDTITASYIPPAHPATFAQAVAACYHAFVHTGEEYAYAVQIHVAVILLAFFSAEDIEAYATLDWDTRQNLMNTVLIPHAAKAGLVTLDSHGQVHYVHPLPAAPVAQFTLASALTDAPPRRV